MDLCTYADIGPLVQQKADPHMAEDLQVMNVVRQLDEACREIGFFYVVGTLLLPRLLGFVFCFFFLGAFEWCLLLCLNCERLPKHLKFCCLMNEVSLSNLGPSGVTPHLKFVKTSQAHCLTMCSVTLVRPQTLG
jgi:hypothetical protein